MFAEMIFLSEEDCDVSVEAAMDALEAAGFESGVMDVDDDGALRGAAASQRWDGRQCVVHVSRVSLKYRRPPIHR